MLRLYHRIMMDGNEMKSLFQRIASAEESVQIAEKRRFITLDTYDAIPGEAAPGVRHVGGS
ncbi:hypothetical protein VAWG006_07630 [Aeromonas enteropelogenes]|uniref:Uncharacterized protein n=1 Tax=Aeromonas sp. 19NY04SH05-1 TaxID=2920537 RepID=A0AAU6TAZ7_9GAMM|nr:hypothetical protein VAWG006_07630 [Aeromonas enteropelogenes]